MDHRRCGSQLFGGKQIDTEFYSCGAYEFVTTFDSDEDAAANFISRILKMEPIIRCFDVVGAYIFYNRLQSCNKIVCGGHHKMARSKLRSPHCKWFEKEGNISPNKNRNIQNCVEMLDRLTEVLIICIMYKISTLLNMYDS